ncbi:stress-inducible protein [Leifsonia xyli subsp. cynodontis DSM 46306]|uniref:Uncharacterized protein n=1 Tax=Leifsonia xyli subsp. cynodontis DSM 46306 TaxID=1389489 RepID=U3P5L7_LEIXC|nr:hypothetical protein [Leifsonia xyli]AGW41076.1 stress-inducible protein [Leifsonia xyli subsp. cynodontis DSM 46306]
MHVQEDLAEVPRLEMDAWAGESLVVLYGPVAASLAGYARTGDVLVVGTDKSGFIHGRVLGSLPVQVAALAVCMVAVIPAVDLRFRAGVVAGIDRHDSAGGGRSDRGSGGDAWRATVAAGAGAPGRAR